MGHLEDQAEVLEQLSECPPDDTSELLQIVSRGLQAMLACEDCDELRQSLRIIDEEQRRLHPMRGASAA